MSDAVTSKLYTPPTGAVAVWGRDLAAFPYLSAFLGAPVRFRPHLRHGVAAVAGWGCEGPAEKGLRMATRLGLPYLAMEDGFLRSLNHDKRHVPACSMVVDTTGIYCDATRPSDLENLLNSTGWETPELLEDARTAMADMLRLRLSKYNHAPDASPYMLTTPGQRARILLIDQPVDDKAVRLGMANASAFTRMLERAKNDHPGAALFLKAHPTVMAGDKKGYLSQTMLGHGVTLIEKDVSPLSLLAQADEVYTVTSQMGFEALMLGKTVHCFGLPFYAGWGLTRDALVCARRTRRRTIAELFAAAYILYSRYVNPITGEPSTIHDIIRLLGEQRRCNSKNSGFTACLGFSRRAAVGARAFLSSTRGQQLFVKDKDVAVREAAAHKGRVVAPVDLVTPELQTLCARSGVPLLRMEDGFFKYSGGENGKNIFSPTPSSMVLETLGRYDDPSRPSTLETVLEHTPMPEALLARAHALGNKMVDAGFVLNSFRRSSAAAAMPDLPPVSGERRIVLVPGQVEDEPSVRLGGEGIYNDRDLLLAVREARPEAFIIYLPHPSEKNSNICADDCLPQAEPQAGAPVGKGKKTIPCDDPIVAASAAKQPDNPLVDAIICNADIAALFPLVHEVHTLTSLSGFDALLRHIPVHTYGGPFYASWGLTTDRLNFTRRSRTLSLSALIAGTLILCPTYYDWHTRMFCDPEDIIRILQPGLPPRHHFPLTMRLRLLRDIFPGK